MDNTPTQRLISYQPVVLIMGVRKSGELESVLCIDKESVSKTIELFNEVRMFFLKECDPLVVIKNMANDK